MTDEDARFLTVIYNNGSRLSAFECGKFAIEEEKSKKSPFKSPDQVWMHLGISKSHFYRCKAIASSPEYILDMFSDVNDVPLVSGHDLAVSVAQYLKKCNYRCSHMKKYFYGFYMV